MSARPLHAASPVMSSSEAALRRARAIWSASAWAAAGVRLRSPVAAPKALSEIAAPTFQFFTLYGVAAVFYWVVCLVLSFGQARLETRLSRHVAV